jgi:NMD protein affecting ribosome stability and mRNA decay
MPPPIPHAKYFEGTLQLRETSPEVREYVHNITRADDKATITQEKRVPGGIDMLFSSMHYLQALGKKLKQKFPGELKITKKLFSQSRETSKVLYRVTVLFRQLPFKLGDVLDVDGEPIKILSIGNRVRTQNTRTGVKKEYTFDDLRRYVRD